MQICSLTLRLARAKCWGYSTQIVFNLTELTKLTRTFRTFLPLSNGHCHEMCCPKLLEALKFRPTGVKMLWLDWLISSYVSPNRERLHRGLVRLRKQNWASHSLSLSDESVITTKPGHRLGVDYLLVCTLNDLKKFVSSSLSGFSRSSAALRLLKNTYLVSIYAGGW